MDTSVTIIGLIITLIIVIPLYFAMRKNSLNKNRINKILKKFNPNNSYNFTTIEHYTQRTLAIDTTSKALLFIDLNPPEESTHFVDLSDALECRVLEVKKDETIKKIDLEITFKNSQNSTIVPFYDSVGDGARTVYLYEEQNIARDWAKLINNAI